MQRFAIKTTTPHSRWNIKPTADEKDEETEIREEKKRKTEASSLFLSRQEGLVPLPLNSTAI